MPHIELRTNDQGDVAQLFIDGKDISHDATAVSIQYDSRNVIRPKGEVTVTYKPSTLNVIGNFTEKEDTR